MPIRSLQSLKNAFIHCKASIEMRQTAIFANELSLMMVYWWMPCTVNRRLPLAEIWKPWRKTYSFFFYSWYLGSNYWIIRGYIDMDGIKQRRKWSTCNCKHGMENNCRCSSTCFWPMPQEQTLYTRLTVDFILDLNPRLVITINAWIQAMWMYYSVIGTEAALVGVSKYPFANAKETSAP